MYRRQKIAGALYLAACILFGVGLAGGETTLPVNAGALQGKRISTTAPTNGQCLVYSTSTEKWAGGSCGPSTPVSVANGGTGTATGSITAATGSPLNFTASQADDGTPQFALKTASQVTNSRPFLKFSHTVSGVETTLHELEIRGGGAPFIADTYFGPLDGVYKTGWLHYGDDGGNDPRTFYHGLHILPESDKHTSLGDYFYDYRWSLVASYTFGGVEQTLGTSGSVTFNPADGEVGYLIATGNVTGITVSAPSNSTQAQFITLVLKQDSGGTSTWPSTFTNCLLAGGTFSKTTTANKVDVISFRRAGALSKWVETSRALNQ